MQHGFVNLKQEIIGATTAGFQPFIGVVNMAVAGMSSLVTAFTLNALNYAAK